MTETLLVENINGIIIKNLIKAFINLTQFFPISAFNELVIEQKYSNIIKNNKALKVKEKIVNSDILKKVYLQ